MPGWQPRWRALTGCGVTCFHARPLPGGVRLRSRGDGHDSGRRRHFGCVPEPGLSTSPRRSPGRTSGADRSIAGRAEDASSLVEVVGSRARTARRTRRSDECGRSRAPRGLQQPWHEPACGGRSRDEGSSGCGPGCAAKRATTLREARQDPRRGHLDARRVDWPRERRRRPGGGLLGSDPPTSRPARHQWRDRRGTWVPPT